MLRKMAYSLVLFAAVSMYMGSASLCASEQDDRIQSSFKETYTYKTYLKDDAVKIASKDGVVTLTGTVSKDMHKTLAQETAANLPGVISVNNELKSTEEVETANSDAWIARKVKLALFFHRHVSYSDTTVDVSEGVVTLSGEAASLAQKELSTEYAKDIDGVKSVRNNMTVAKPMAGEDRTNGATRTAGEKIDDASLTAQVKTALQNYRSTNASAVKIVARDGEVTLTGIARNAAEKELITKRVQDIRGVNNVRNMMTVNVDANGKVRTIGVMADDAALTAQVKGALQMNKSLQGVNTGVETREGKVTLTGIAKNAAEKTLITKIATDVPGVKSVDNQMTINTIMTK